MAESNNARLTCATMLLATAAALRRSATLSPCRRWRATSRQLGAYYMWRENNTCICQVYLYEEDFRNESWTYMYMCGSIEWSVYNSR